MIDLILLMIIIAYIAYIHCDALLWNKLDFSKDIIFYNWFISSNGTLSEHKCLSDE